MNFKEMCRTCLRSGEMMSSIFDEEIEPAKHTAAELLTIFTSIQVNKEDDFPHKICDMCLKEIQQAYLFDLKCKKSEIILHQLREIRVNLKKLKEIPKQNNIVSEVADELESILKVDFKLEDIMNHCERKITDFVSSASGRIRSVEEKNANATEKSNLRIVEEECTRDFQVAPKSESVHSNHLIKNNKNEKDVECIQIVSNFPILEEYCDPQITLKQEPDHNSPIIMNIAAQNKLELNRNSSNFEILDECSSDYQVIFKTEPDQNNLIIKGNENELEFSVTDFPVIFKSEPELNIGIDCNDERLQCSACLKHFQSLDMFRGHIVSDHLEENICKLCKEEFECSQFEHSAKHLPLSKQEKPSGSIREPIIQTEKVHMTATYKDESFGKLDFQCKICSKVFVHRCRLVNHMRIHTGEKPFQCKLCPAKFGHSNTLLYHRRSKHTDELISDDKPIPDFQCSICSKIFGQKWLLKRHMHVHTGEKPFQCKLCPAKFGHSNTLLYHIRTKHTDELISNNKTVADLQCSVCYKVCGRKSLLKVHMRVHTGEKPFHCELCPEKFGNSTALLSHRRTKHTEELISDDKPVPDFQCSICYKVFGMKCLLRNHMRSHTGEKPFNCELCPAKFRHSETLLSHRRTKHTDALISDHKLLQCSVCYKVFGRKSLLRDHMRVHTGENPFHCKLNPVKFQKRETLPRQTRTKPTDELISDGKPEARLLMQ